MIKTSKQWYCPSGCKTFGMKGLSELHKNQNCSMEHCEQVKNGLSPLRYENTCVACSTKCNALWVIFF